jgi:hypothetical protein
MITSNDSWKDACLDGLGMGRFRLWVLATYIVRKSFHRSFKICLIAEKCLRTQYQRRVPAAILLPRRVQEIVTSDCNKDDNRDQQDFVSKDFWDCQISNQGKDIGRCLAPTFCVVNQYTHLIVR